MNQTFSEFDLKAVAAAHFCSRGDKQIVISEKLKVSQPQVSRLLKHARKRGLLVDRDPIFSVTCRDHLLWDEARQRFVSDDPLVRELRHLSGGLLKRVHVIYGKADDFYPEAARALIPLLNHVRLVGVTWGRTLCMTAEALQRLSPQPLRSSPRSVEFIPLCGEPFEDREDPLQYSSSALVSLLTQVVAGPKAPNPLSLAGVYAFIPCSFAGPDVSLIRRFLLLGKGYRAIFGDPNARRQHPRPPLVEQLDTILTGVGAPITQRQGIFLTERINQGDLSKDDLHHLLGDMSGILVPKRTCPEPLRRRIAELNGDRWTGMKEDHIRRCAHAHPAKSPGVVVIASHKNRARMILRCAQDEMINTLIISKELANEILRLIRNGTTDF